MSEVNVRSECLWPRKISRYCQLYSNVNGQCQKWLSELWSDSQDWFGIHLSMSEVNVRSECQCLSLAEVWITRLILGISSMSEVNVRSECQWQNRDCQCQKWMSEWHIILLILGMVNSVRSIIIIDLSLSYFCPWHNILLSLSFCNNDPFSFNTFFQHCYVSWLEHALLDLSWTRFIIFSQSSSLVNKEQLFIVIGGNNSDLVVRLLLLAFDVRVQVQCGK